MTAAGRRPTQEETARALRPEAVALLTAAAAGWGLTLSYAACPSNFEARLDQPDAYLAQWHGGILFYTSWNDRYAVAGGHAVAPHEVSGYLAVYTDHPAWHADDLLAFARRRAKAVPHPDGGGAGRTGER